MSVNSKSVRRQHHGAFFAAAICAAASLVVAIPLAPQISVAIAANSFFLVYLGLAWWRISGLTATYLKNHAAAADEPAIAILAVSLLAAGVAVVSLFLALNRSSGAGAVELVLLGASVVSGWATIHTMAAMHYAHLFWRPSGSPAKKQQKGGMDFPQTVSPCGYDFLYFAFVIGMTAQTSDVGVTTTTMRRVTLMHSIISYFFNTVLVAAAVNVAVSLAT
jgi:uncharacterized membrane protein